MKIFSVKMTGKVWNNQVKYTYRTVDIATLPVGGSEYAAFTGHVIQPYTRHYGYVCLWSEACR